MIREDELFTALLERVMSELGAMMDPSDEQALERIEALVLAADELRDATAGEKHRLVRRLFHTLRGFDALQPLIDDKSVTEIMINAHDRIFVERDGRVEQAPIQLASEQRLLELIRNVVGKVNRVVTESSPIVDARLKDGSRVHVVLPPVALQGPTMTIRKFPDKPMTMERLIEIGSVSEEAAIFLKEVVQAKYTLFIGGGTGSGKTTLLNVLSQYIPYDERVITIEDAAELQIGHVPNLVRLETRNSNADGKGGIPMRELIRASLRMRPNRIIVGEVRGAEAIDMLQAMNTGHEGSLSTGHANSARDMIRRLETMVLTGAPLPLEAIRQQIASAIDIVVHLSRLRDKTRRVMEIHEVVGVSEDEVRLEPLFLFEQTGGDSERLFGALERTQHRLRNRAKLRAAGMSDERW